MQRQRSLSIEDPLVPREVTMGLALALGIQDEDGVEEEEEEEETLGEHEQAGERKGAGQGTTGGDLADRKAADSNEKAQHDSIERIPHGGARHSAMHSPGRSSRSLGGRCESGSGRVELTPSRASGSASGSTETRGVPKAEREPSMRGAAAPVPLSQLRSMWPLRPWSSKALAAAEGLAAVLARRAWQEATDSGLVSGVTSAEQLLGGVLRSAAAVRGSMDDWLQPDGIQRGPADATSGDRAVAPSGGERGLPVGHGTFVRSLRAVVEDVSIGSRLGASEAPIARDAFIGGSDATARLLEAVAPFTGSLVVLAHHRTIELARAVQVLACCGNVPHVICLQIS